MGSKEIFYTFVKAGLWEKVSDNENFNDNLLNGEVQKLAEEQSVIGLVAAGLEKFPPDIIPLTEKLTLLGKCQLLEQRYVAMN